MRISDDFFFHFVFREREGKGRGTYSHLEEEERRKEEQEREHEGEGWVVGGTKTDELGGQEMSNTYALMLSNRALISFLYLYFISFFVVTHLFKTYNLKSSSSLLFSLKALLPPQS